MQIFDPAEFCPEACQAISFGRKWEAIIAVQEGTNDPWLIVCVDDWAVCAFSAN